MGKNNEEGNSFPSELGSARTDQVVVQVQGDDKTLIQEVSKLVTRADRAFLITTTKTKAQRSIEDHDELKMCIRDQHVDVFCRYAFPLAYFVTFMALFLRCLTSRRWRRFSLMRA